ncbi:MAG TPA: ATP-dependent DNA helicase RecG, partial [Chroococcales cyanobacterium]
MRRAIAVERRAYYSDFQGRRTTFSNFMRTTADKLCKRYPTEHIWTTIRGLFRQYPNQDVATRISIIKRADELLTPLWEAQGEVIARTVLPEPDEECLRKRPMQISESEKQAKALPPPDSAMGVGPWARPRTVAPAPSGDGQPAAASTEAKQPAPSQEAKRSTPSAAEPNTQAKNEAAAKKATLQREAQKPVIKPVIKPESSPAKSATGPDGNQKTRSETLPPKPASAAEGSGKHSTPAETPVKFVRGVGPKAAAVLSKLGIETVLDLLKHYPRRHLDFQNRDLIKNLEVGMEVSIFGNIRSVGAFQSKRGNVSIINILIHDNTGSITVTRFIGGRSNKFLLDRYKNQFPKGAQVIASGVVERDGYSNKLILKNAEVEVLSQVADSDSSEFDTAGAESGNTSIHAGRIVPVYSLTEGVGLRYLRNIIHNALDAFGAKIEDPLPELVRQKLALPVLQWAFQNIHFPDDPEAKDQARQRLVFDELFSIQLQMAHRRYKFDASKEALQIRLNPDGLVQRLKDSLPFQLTGAQTRVFGEISHDLASSKPMHRLVQGDVGSGKTVVALMAFLMAIESGYQCVMMAPTEILAEQHFRQFQRLITPLGLRTCLVVGKQGQKERREVRQQLLSGQIHIAVGTHALLEEDVEFQNLGLIIIDEQHRFGVKQRARLKAKSQSPELLTMTATPIPRTLALTMHGDLDVSEIDEMPPGRKPIKTTLHRPKDKEKIWECIQQELDQGRQAYIVFPLIEESESLSAKAATAEFEKLVAKHPEIKIGLMHGKLRPQEKDEVMEKFRSREFQILVCTTVIEVGVDVPNATVMVIENADRFGLAALHQLRGRVGRGGDQSYCLLVADAKSDATRQRLEILTQTNDGFVVAEKDLELRGPGEFLGYRQSGLPDLMLADLVADA